MKQLTRRPHEAGKKTHIQYVTAFTLAAALVAGGALALAPSGLGGQQADQAFAASKTKAATSKSTAKKKTTAKKTTTKKKAKKKVKKTKLTSKKVTVTGLEPIYAYKGKKIKPKVKVYYKGTKLKKSRDYKISYTDNKKVGKAKLVIKGKGTYKGKVTKKFKIRYSLASKGKVKLVRTSYVYTGERFKPEAVVKYKSKVLVKGEDYKLVYSGGRVVGTHTVTAKGKGEYAFEATATYKVKAQGGKIIDVSYWQDEIDWQKVASKVDGAILRSQVTYASHRGIEDLDTGKARQDVRYDEYATGCEAHDLPYGVYAYMIWRSEEDAVRQAELFWYNSVVNGHRPLYFAFDLEDDSMLKLYFDPETGEKLPKAKSVDERLEIAQWAGAAADRMRELAREAGWTENLKIGVYVGGASYDYFGFSTDEGQAVLGEKLDFVWYPRYGKNDGEVPTAPYLPVYPYDLWQYTSNGLVSGIEGTVDMSIVNTAGPHGHPVAWYLTR